MCRTRKTSIQTQGLLALCLLYTSLEQKEEEQKKRAELVEARLAEIEQMRERETEKLEHISGLSEEAAKEMLLSRLDEELVHEKALKISAFETQTKEDCDKLAQELITQAVSRCAADHSSEITVSVVPLPRDVYKRQA